MNAGGTNSVVAPGPQETRPGAKRKLHPVRSLRAHAALAMLLFVLIVAGGFRIAWKKGKPRYASQAVIYVSPRFLKNMQDDKEFELQSNSQYREFVQQNVRTIDRYDIVQEAVRRLSRQGQPWQRPNEPEDHAVQRLQGELKILPVPDTYQITVRLEGEQRDFLAETVNAVAAVFLERSREEDFYGRDQRLASLQEEEQELKTSIAAAASEKDKIAQQLAVSVFSESFSNPFDQLLVGSKQALAAARQKQIVSDAALDALQKQLASGSNNGLHAYADELARKDADMTSLQSNLNFRRSELLSKRAGMLPNHPGRIEIESQLRQIDEVAGSKREDLEKAYASILLTQRQAEAAADDRAARDLSRQVEQQAAQAIWYSHNYQKGINIRYEMERSRKRLEDIQDRIDFVLQEGRAQGFARMFSLARRPLEPLSGGRKKPVLILVLCATAASLVLPLALDYLDPRLHSPDEAEKLLGFAPLGFTLAPSYNGAGNDRIRRLAAAIEREAERNNSRSFVFVPVNAAVLIEDTVEGIAHELLALGHDVKMLGQTAAARHCTAGAVSAAAELHRDSAQRPFGATRSRLRGLVERGVIVLFSAEPFSENPETELLVSCCDVVVLALRSGETRKADVQAALRTLEDIKPRAMAALVTGHDPNPPLPEIRLGFTTAREVWRKFARERQQKPGFA